MRYLLITLALLLCTGQQLLAQSSLSVEYSQNFTNLRFVDASETRYTEMTPHYGSAFNIGYAFALKQGIYFNSKIGLRQAGASYVYDDFNYSWDMNYAEFRLGVGYQYGIGPLLVNLSTQGYAGYLYQAQQQLHNTRRDMLADGTFARWDFGLFFGPGVVYPLNEKMALNLNVDYMLGLNNIETQEGQSSMNNLIGATVGFSFKL